MLAVQLAHEACQSASAQGGSRKSGRAQGWEVVGWLSDLLLVDGVEVDRVWHNYKKFAISGRSPMGPEVGLHASAGSEGFQPPHFYCIVLY